ncbi:HdeD family acid-resistance protein [Nocardia sp. NPDC056100]|uniref:HdeD family acid-resistance protein n=1 Tax=Nocardia sp. NPDC056100 TaxID=3345712 RepID=UPI0035DDC4B5
MVNQGSPETCGLERLREQRAFRIIGAELERRLVQIMTGTESVTGPLQQMARAAWQMILLTGILSVVLGVLILSWPGPTLVVAGVLFGTYLVVAGIMQLVTAFGDHIPAGVRIFAFLSGALSLILGFFCFRDALESILLLALWIGIGWLFRGITQLIAALSDPVVPARGWQVFFGIVIIVGGAMLIVSPFDSISVLTLFAGWWLIALGVMEALHALQMRRVVAG